MLENENLIHHCNCLGWHQNGMTASYNTVRYFLRHLRVIICNALSGVSFATLYRFENASGKHASNVPLRLQLK
ncbi:MAG: hypothetical protein WDA26_10000 [Pusillimonas sp.]